MTPAEKILLEERLDLKYVIVKVVNDYRAVMDLFWSDFGIADVGTTSTHVLDVKKDGVSLSGYPKTYTNLQAFNTGYSDRIDNWDLRSSYDISLTVNSDSQFSKVVPPFVGYKAPVPRVFDPNTVKASLINTEEGIKVKVFSSCGSCLDEIYSIVVSKGVDGGPLAEAFRNSVPVSYVLDTNYANYYTLIVDGLKKPSNTTDFNAILNNRESILFYIKSSGAPYLEVTDLDIIAKYSKDDIVDVGSLNPLVFQRSLSDPNVLYYELKTGKYYRFREVRFSLPYQYPQEEAYQNSKWFAPAAFANGDTTFDIFVPGYQSEAGDTFAVSAALKDDKQNITELHTLLPQDAGDLSLLLSPGVVFMDSRLDHIDTDVVDGSIYEYKVEIVMPNGSTHIVFEGNTKRFTPSRGGLSDNVFLDNIKYTQNPDSTLTETDFQSGVANGHLQVTLSDDPEDYKLFVALKDRAGTIKCQ